jgi:hypothetical protein
MARKWWILSYAREDMIAALDKLPRYVVCGRVTKRPIFEFVDVRIRPNDALQVFPYADDFPLKAVHGALDDAVRVAYGMGKDEDALEFLLNVNAQVASAEADARKVQGPGLPECVADRASYITNDCISA